MSVETENAAAFAAVRPAVELPIRIREFNEPDKNFVLNSWLKSYRDSPWAFHLDNDTYFYGHQLLIGKLAETSKLYVACSVDDPNEIWGWLCAEKGPPGTVVIHYVNVKQRFRKFGVAKALLQAAGWRPGVKVWATHWTEKAELLCNKFNAHYNPYFLCRGFL